MHKSKLVLDLENYGYLEALNFRHLLTANKNLDKVRKQEYHAQKAAATPSVNQNLDLHVSRSKQKREKKKRRSPQI